VVGEFEGQARSRVLGLTQGRGCWQERPWRNSELVRIPFIALRKRGALPEFC
jgi:hypothetical protein